MFANKPHTGFYLYTLFYFEYIIKLAAFILLYTMFHTINVSMESFASVLISK